MSIQVLSPQLANQIAAGEVVERPASVIKELIENCIDSGADCLDIDIEQGGCKLIRVRDNGCGIPKDELPLALARHATSKISSLDDLSAIISLGFRGEALASISSVSRLTLTSRTKEQSEAWQVYAEGREMNAIVKPAAHPIGTTVEVLDLFYNTPARRRFLRTEKTEFTHIDEVVRRVALARPDMTINLSHNGKLTRQYRGAKSQDQIDKRVATVAGLAFIQHAIKLEWQHDDLNIKGWIANVPGCDLQYFYVNGRIVKDRLLNHAIRQAYQNQLKGDNIAYVIYLELDPHQVDVNVHPSKHEVRFHEARLVHDFVHQAILMGLDVHLKQETEQESDHNTTSTLLVQNRQAAGSNVFEQPKKSSPSSSSNDHYSSYKPTTLNKGHAREQQAYQQLLNAARSEPTISHHQAEHSEIPLPKIPDDSQRVLFPERKEPLVLQTTAAEVIDDSPASAKFGKVLTVYKKQYAILEDGQQLQLLSLPLAQQQLYIGKLCEQMTKPAETLLIPLKLLLSKKEQQLFIAHYDLFVALNIKFNIEKDKLQLNEVPLLLRNMNWQQLLPLLIDYLDTQLALTKDALILWLAKQYYTFCFSNKAEWTLTQVVCLLTDLEQISESYINKKIFLQLIDFSSLIKNFSN